MGLRRLTDFLYRDRTPIRAGGVVYSPNTGETVTNTATETDLHTFTFGAPLPTERVIRLISTGSVLAWAAGNVTIRAYLGGTLVSGIFSSLGALNESLGFEMTLMIGTPGAAGSVRRHVIAHANSASLATPLFRDGNISSVDLSGTPILKTTAEWSVANPGNSYTERLFIVEYF